jgi:GNAT superfamily N-acetyltransferase
MKTFHEILAEGRKSTRLVHEIKDLRERWFISSYLKDTEKNWLDGDQKILAVETTIDINKKDKSIYLNRQDARRRGKGYGQETMEFILKLAKKKGFKKAKGYVEYSNSAPISMLKNLGFKKADDSKFGSYFIKIL